MLVKGATGRIIVALVAAVFGRKPVTSRLQCMCDRGFTFNIAWYLHQGSFYLKGLTDISVLDYVIISMVFSGM